MCFGLYTMWFLQFCPQLLPIISLLQRCPHFIVNEVIKGGSLGHGTVVPGHFDTDLVLYSQSEPLWLMIKSDTVII